MVILGKSSIVPPYMGHIRNKNKLRLVLEPRDRSRGRFQRTNLQVIACMWRLYLNQHSRMLLIRTPDLYSEMSTSNSVISYE